MHCAATPEGGHCHAGLKSAQSPPRRSSIFAPPGVAALGAVAALPAALPAAVIADGAGARGAYINRLNFPVRLAAHLALLA